MEFKKYQHLERFGNDEVQGIELGECYIFPKIDGTNASIWMNEEGEVQCGSRRRHLALGDDNAGFRGWAVQQENILRYLQENPTHRLYGEWLVPHSLKTYREDAWRKFYVFDICVDKTEEEIRHDGDDTQKYLHYEGYRLLLDKHNIDYIDPIAVITNSDYDTLISQLDKNTFLIEDGKGAGEGIVIKNYDYTGKHDRQTWAKIITSEFHEKHSRAMGPSIINGKKMVEIEIVDKYITKALCEKVKAKISLDNDGFNNKNIPQLLSTVYHDLIIEEAWDFVKKMKNPTVNFKTLQSLVFRKVKEHLLI